MFSNFFYPFYPGFQMRNVNVNICKQNLMLIRTNRLMNYPAKCPKSIAQLLDCVRDSRNAM